MLVPFRSASRLCLVIAGLVGFLASIAPAQRAQVPPGKIYFTHQNLTWSMNGDGSSKTALPAGVAGEPSRQLHGGRRWFLQLLQVGGTYPDGTPRQELFAAREDGGYSIQLTTQADLQPFPGFPNVVRWKFDDGSVSWVAARWVGTALTAGGLYAADIQFDGGGNVVGLTSQPAAPLIPCAIITMNNGSVVRPEIGEHDWAPDDFRLIFGTMGDLASQRRLYIGESLIPGGAPQLVPTSTPASDPSWSPDGTKIAYQQGAAPGDLYTINTNGSGEKRIARVHGGWINGFFPPHWSSNGQYLVYGEWGSVLNDDREDVYRIKADGSSKANLTSDLNTRALSGSPARPVDWR